MLEDLQLAARDHLLIRKADDAKRDMNSRLHEDRGTCFPRPPKMLCSSTVTTARHLPAARMSASTSSGLTVCMLMTRADALCASSFPAAPRLCTALP